ncbi:hypothetical protein [Pseudoalteromonas luteoviolacea]|uniref:hypothetical protein n=1 Tax=Pseudoalteromonas luteoviolacea TaxID=43657 RepID=UPI00114DDEED|nr:hypothetical protein [Pseudoalteromonas luteoviolacea]TQF70114.1 hypothetical protein FLM44_03200 [Pseudoalteromonas luteoviolacea]
MAGKAGGGKCELVLLYYRQHLQVTQTHSGRIKHCLRGTTYTVFRLPLSKALAVEGSMVNPSVFRNKIITEISIKYVWDGSLHSAMISLSDQNGFEKAYRLDGLLEFSIYDDFGTMHISQVKIINLGTQTYLSLDPYEELNEVADYDKDNIWFQFTSIEPC